MRQSHPCNERQLSTRQSYSRSAQLHYFYSIKEKIQFISREVLYLAIALLDKYFFMTSSYGLANTPSPRKMLVRAATSLWIAWKFLENQHIPLGKLAHKIDDSCTLKEEMMEMQVEILEGVEFQVPADFAYAAMVRAYSALPHTCTSKKLIVSQCLAFLRQGVDQSPDFSLCPQLGGSILHLVQRRSVNDRRVKEVCAIIYSKKHKGDKIEERSGAEVHAK